jgi:hypothetical protein
MEEIVSIPRKERETITHTLDRIQIQKFLGAQYANLFMTSLQVNDKIHEPSKYLWSFFSI